MKVLRLKRKFKNKKGSNLLRTTWRSELFCNDSYFMGGLRARTKGILFGPRVQRYFLMLRRLVGKGRISWPRVRLIFNLDFYKTKKSTGQRMGGGKGKLNYWSRVVLPGQCFLKVVSYSDQDCFFDSFSWSLLFWFFHFLLDSAFGDLERVRIWKLRRMGFLTARFRLRMLVFLTDFPRRRRLVSFLYGSYFRSGISFSLNRAIRRLVFGGRVVFHSFFRFFLKSYFKLAFYSLFSFSSFSERLGRFSVCRRSRSHLSLFLLRFWLAGFIYKCFARYVFRRGELKKARKVTKMFRKFYNRMTCFKNRRFDLLSESMDNFDEFDYLNVESTYESRRGYPNRRRSFIWSVCRGLTRVQSKLGFDSDVILPFSYLQTYLKIKRFRRLFHRTQNRRH